MAGRGRTERALSERIIGRGAQNPAHARTAGTDQALATTAQPVRAVHAMHIAPCDVRDAAPPPGTTLDRVESALERAWSWTAAATAHRPRTFGRPAQPPDDATCAMQDMTCMYRYGPYAYRYGNMLLHC